VPINLRGVILEPGKDPDWYWHMVYGVQGFLIDPQFGTKTKAADLADRNFSTDYYHFEYSTKHPKIMTVTSRDAPMRLNNGLESIHWTLAAFSDNPVETILRTATPDRVHKDPAALNELLERYLGAYLPTKYGEITSNLKLLEVLNDLPKDTMVPITFKGRGSVLSYMVYAENSTLYDPTNLIKASVADLKGDPEFMKELGKYGGFEVYGRASDGIGKTVEGDGRRRGGRSTVMPI